MTSQWVSETEFRQLLLGGGIVDGCTAAAYGSLVLRR